MNTIEQAIKRIEELRRAGVEVSLPGTEEAPPTSGASQSPTPPSSSSPSAQALQGAAAAMRGAGLRAPLGGAADEPPTAAVSAQAPGWEGRQAAASQSPRRSREIQLDLDMLRKKGFLVPGSDDRQREEEYRIVKRPLLKNAAGESAAPIERANLIMVTSALPGEGKTYTAINLAMSIAMELDHTVLLVDADVVRPSVLSRLGQPSTKGLMDVLTDPNQDLADVLLRTNIPKLTLLPAGNATHRTTELLASTAMEDLLTELATHYQDRIVIFDAPPLLPSTESRVLAARMGQVLMVVEADKTPKSTVEQAFATLENCPVVMGMLNKQRGPGSGAVYGYYQPT